MASFAFEKLQVKVLHSPPPVPPKAQYSDRAHVYVHHHWLSAAARRDLQ